MTTISTHILDISEGVPAVGVIIRLQQLVQEKVILIASGVTNATGRIDSFAETELREGHYQLIAETGPWWRQQGRSSVFCQAQIDIFVEKCSGHVHLPFLISPGGWSTYKGTRG
jgi:5-hydroxyisourate hydrolase